MPASTLDVLAPATCPSHGRASTRTCARCGAFVCDLCLAPRRPEPICSACHERELPKVRRRAWVLSQLGFWTAMLAFFGALSTSGDVFVVDAVTVILASAPGVLAVGSAALSGRALRSQRVASGAWRWFAMTGLLLAATAAAIALRQAYVVASILRVAPPA